MQEDINAKMERGRRARMRASGPRSLSRSFANKQACSLTNELISHCSNRMRAISVFRAASH